MHISILVLIGLLAAAFILGALVAWNNSKASVKAAVQAKIDAALQTASGDAKAALNQLKAKL